MDKKKIKILAVDDAPVNLKVITGFLTPHGYEVITAGNGKTALTKMQTNDIDMVLLDVMMPGISGFEVCEEIKKDPRYLNIPVIMITALQSKEARIKGIEAGADDFLLKPFDEDELLARIKMLLHLKDLNSNLGKAYNKLKALSSIGRKFINHFDPLTFNFLHGLSALMTPIIQPNGKSMSGAEMVLFQFAGERKKNIYLYSSDSFEIKKETIDLEIRAYHPRQRVKHLVIYKESDCHSPEFRYVAKTLEACGRYAVNMICFWHNDFYLAAINYENEITEYDENLIENLVGQSLFLKSISGQIQEQEGVFSYMVDSLARAAEANDEDTGDHILRVATYSALLAKEMAMPEKFIDIISQQAQMHDVGKIHVHPDILRKPEKLSEEEFRQIQQHTEHGARILGDHVRLTMAKEIALAHHERWDGTGYPHGLRGEEIPLPARIVNIADQYDALRNVRCYKAAFDHEKAFRIITEGDGRTMPHHFDPVVLQAFEQSANKFAEIYETLQAG